jgi:DNA-binding transcriptional MerR regulator
MTRSAPTAPTARDPRVPDREAFRIGEVARLAGVATSVLRYWESEFPSLRPAKTRAGQRLYGRADVEAVLRIRDLLYDRGYTIAGARQVVEGAGGEVTPDERRRAAVEAIRNEIDDLLRLLDE